MPGERDAARPWLNIRRMPHAPDFSESLPPVLLHDLPARAAALWPTQRALTSGDQHLAYVDLQAQVSAFASGLLSLGLGSGERVAVFLEKRVEAVAASFAAPAAGGVLVPVNPLLKPAQVAHILQDSGARVLITSTLPPWELTMTSLRIPASATFVPIAVQAGIRISGPKDRLPGP